jgi:hypothetical protein
MPWSGVDLEKSNSSLASQDITQILLNPKIHFSVHKGSQETVSLKTQNASFNNTTSAFALYHLK